MVDLDENCGRKWSGKRSISFSEYQENLFSSQRFDPLEQESDYSLDGPIGLSPRYSPEEDLQISDIMENNQSSSTDFVIDDTNDDQKNSLVTTYPWIQYFRQKCLSELMNCNMKSLMKLIKFYNSNISKAVEDCYHKPKRAMKLKIELSNTLTFFYFAYKEIKTPLEHFSYLEKMSDLMAMYVDMEIKASRNGIESVKKVASKITSSLKLYFGKYPEYIIASLLKTNLTNKRCSDLGDLIFRWVLRDGPESPLDSISYIQNILAYKMWKEIMQGSKLEQQRITKLACMRIEPPVGFKEKLKSIQELRDLFPILPHSDITNFLMKAKFSSMEKTKIFYKAITNPVVLASLNNTYLPFMEDSDSVFCEKGNSKVDQLLNNLWDILNDNRGVNSSVMKNVAMNSPDELSKNSKFKRKREGTIDDIKSEPNKNSTENIPVAGEDKHSIKLETEDVFIRLTYESLYEYEHSIEDFFHAEEENKDMLCWKPDLEVKKEKESYIMKEEKSEDYDTSECCMKSDLEDEIISSSNECLFDLNVVEGEKGNDGEHSSNLPLKKRRGFPYNKFVKNDSTDTSDMVSGEPEERKMVFKTPAQLKAFSNSFNEPTDLINLALGSHSVYSEKNDDPSYSVSREADSVTENSFPHLIKRKATSTSRRGRRKGRGRPRKKKLLEQAEESNRLLDELTTTAGFFK